MPETGKFFNVVKQIFCLIRRMFDLKKRFSRSNLRHNRKRRSKLKLVDNVILNLRVEVAVKRSNNGRCRSEAIAGAMLR